MPASADPQRTREAMQASLEALRGWRSDNALANAQHLIDLNSFPDPGKEPTYGQQIAMQRAADHVAEGVDIGGITAWHGTPYKFTKFDPSKIGSGEGAQVYGKGLYLAESPGVAKDYRRNLSKRQVVADLNERYDDLGTSWDAYSDFMNDPKVSIDQKRFVARLKQEDYLGYDNPAQGASNVMDPRSGHVISNALARSRNNLGNLYKVDVPDPHVASMLDWDKPLYDQRPLVERLEKASNDPDKVNLRKTLDLMALDPTVRTGETVMNSLPFLEAGSSGVARAAKNRAQVGIASDLEAAGVPGVKYLDAMSRNNVGGTSNFVVFPSYQKDLSILERNGRPINSWGE